jgi:hypothetical protein
LRNARRKCGDCRWLGRGGLAAKSALLRPSAFRVFQGTKSSRPAISGRKPAPNRISAAKSPENATQAIDPENRNYFPELFPPPSENFFQGVTKSAGAAIIETFSYSD